MVRVSESSLHRTFEREAGSGEHSPSHCTERQSNEVKHKQFNFDLTIIIMNEKHPAPRKGAVLIKCYYVYKIYGTYTLSTCTT